VEIPYSASTILYTARRRALWVIWPYGRHLPVAAPDFKPVRCASALVVRLYSVRQHSAFMLQQRQPAHLSSLHSPTSSCPALPVNQLQYHLVAHQPLKQALSNVTALTTISTSVGIAMLSLAKLPLSASS